MEEWRAGQGASGEEWEAHREGLSLWPSTSFFFFSFKGEKSDNKTGENERKNGDDWGEERKQEREDEKKFLFSSMKEDKRT